MRFLAMVFVMFVFLSGTVTAIPAQDKKAQDEKRQKQFEETKKLIETRNFIFEASRAFPQGVASIDLTTNYGFLKVKEDSTVVGDLPFFGRAYNIDYGGGGGIEFSGKMEDLKYSVNSEKNSISYSFNVKDDDYFRILLDISYDGGASLNVISQDRSSISYQGDISFPEED